jgi:hypothetical protein
VARYTEGFSHFVTSMTAPVASGWSGCRVGLAPTGKRRLSRRTPDAGIRNQGVNDWTREGCASEVAKFQWPQDCLTAFERIRRNPAEAGKRPPEAARVLFTSNPLP